MPWKNQSGGGGPWGTGGGGGGQGPWGAGGRPPDLEDMLRRGQDRMKRFLPGGVGKGRGLILIVLVGLAIWLATGFYRVEPDEQGIALIFGRVWKQTPPGLSYNLPAPIGEVYTPKVTRINRVEVGFRTNGDSDSGGSAQDVPEESLMLTGDRRIIDMQFTVFWAIKDPQLTCSPLRNRKTRSRTSRKRRCARSSADPTSSICAPKDRRRRSRRRWR